jgi:hypothetical protein
LSTLLEVVKVIELFERSNICPVGGYQIFVTFIVDSKMVIFVDEIFIVPGNLKITQGRDWIGNFESRLA